ncbi:MAG: family oxidoreductase [Acidimicrobiales bacterium]|nr:family oxidoreductase [Acidimicrobiales bacterium]
MWLEKFDFEGRLVIVTGGASGMGSACASTLSELGADVHVLDVQEPATTVGSYHRVDLRDEHSIDAAVSAIGSGTVHALFNCAGMPQTFPYADVLACNIAGLRHLTESIVPLMTVGSSIVNVTSAAAFRWEPQTEVLNEMLDTPTMAAAIDWFGDHPDLGDPYVFSKMALSLYTLRRAPQLAPLGIRMNAVAPANTITGMTDHFVEAVGQKTLEIYERTIGYPSTPQQQADVMVFLASAAASYIAGVILHVDGGFLAAATTRQLKSKR